MTPEATLGTSVSILSLMITPVILILAAASLVGATTTRLERIGESMHEMAESFEHHVAAEHSHDTLREEQLRLWIQIERTGHRVRLLQITVALLHASILAFVLTSIGLGLDAATGLELGLIPVVVGLLGAMLLFAAIVVLVYDALIAVRATREEAEFTLRMTEHRAAKSRHEIARPSKRTPLPFT